jgi:hypothetical protein
MAIIHFLSSYLYWLLCSIVPIEDGIIENVRIIAFIIFYSSACLFSGACFHNILFS